MEKTKEKRIQNEDWWNIYSKQMKANKSLAMHFGYYEKGIRTHEEAVLNKNILIEQHLDLNLLNHKEKILDAGCGVGGTSIYFAKKHPHIKFIGINNSQSQIRLASKFAKQFNVSSNTEFILGDFLATGLPENYVDGIFALESITRLKDKKRFLQETNRILKQNKKLVIDDVFLIKIPSNYFIKKAYKAYCNTWKIPDIMPLKNFKTYLEDLKFSDIKTMDITKNSWLSFFITYIKMLSYSVFLRPKSKSKKTIFKKNKNISPILRNLYIYFIVMFFTSLLLLLNHNIRKIVITAIKK